MHCNGIAVVVALRVSEPAQQRHEGRAAARQLVGGVTDGAVVHPKSHDLVREVLAVLLHTVNKGDELLVLDVGVGHGVGVPTAPVENAIHDVAPPDLASRIGLEGDDGQGGVGEEDPATLDGVGELARPPLGVEASAGVDVSGRR